MFVAGMTGCNHLFGQEPRGLPIRQYRQGSMGDDSAEPKVNGKRPVPRRKTSTA